MYSEMPGLFFNLLVCSLPEPQAARGSPSQQKRSNFLADPFDCISSPTRRYGVLDSSLPVLLHDFVGNLRAQLL